MQTPAATVFTATLVLAACSPGSEAARSCKELADAAYVLEVPVGEMRLPGRLDLLCLDGERAWGRLLVSLGRDTLTGAIAFAERRADTVAFASGGAVTGLTLVRAGADSARGTIHLAGGRSFGFHAAVDAGGARPGLAQHAVLGPVQPGLVSTDSGESYPVPVAGDGLIFTRHGADLTRQRLMRAPADGQLGPLLEVPAGVTDRSPSLSPDGSVLLFASNRDPANPGTPVDRTSLWFMRAAGGGWSAPRPVSWPTADRAASPQQPLLTPDGTLYFVDDRPDGLGGRDAYRARWRDGSVSGVRRVPAPVSTPADEAGLHLSRDGRTLVVARTRGPGHQGGDDLYVHIRTAEGWSEPVNLGLPVNTFANEYGPWLSAGGDRLWFASDRFGSADLFSVETVQGADGTLILAPAR